MEEITLLTKDYRNLDEHENALKQSRCLRHTSWMQPTSVKEELSRVAPHNRQIQTGTIPKRIQPRQPRLLLLCSALLWLQLKSSVLQTLPYPSAQRQPTARVIALKSGNHRLSSSFKSVRILLQGILNMLPFSPALWLWTRCIMSLRNDSHWQSETEMCLWS